MRVLLLCHRFPPDSVAGVERITQTLAAELAKTGDEVTIVTRRPALTPAEPELVRERLRDGAMLYRFVGGQVRLDRFLAHDERLQHLFGRVMVETAPDVVHVLHLLGFSPLSLELTRRHRVALVVSLQDFFFACPLAHLQKRSRELCEGPEGGKECARTCFAGEGEEAPLRWGLRATYFRRLLALAQRVICPSEYVASYFSRFGLSCLRIVPNGVPLVATGGVQANSIPTEHTKLRLAFLGSVVPHKGVHVIIESLRIAGLNSVDLRILGQVADSQYEAEIRKDAATVPGLRLRLYGAYEARELPYLLGDVDCVVTPSQVPETFSIATHEALALGIPALVTRLGALPETVAEGHNGFTFSHDQPRELAAILRRLARDEALLLRLKARARSTPFLTTAEHAAAVRSVYSEAIESGISQEVFPHGNSAELTFLHDQLSTLGFSTA